MIGSTAQNQIYVLLSQNLGDVGMIATGRYPKILRNHHVTMSVDSYQPANSKAFSDLSRQVDHAGFRLCCFHVIHIEGAIRPLTCYLHLVDASL